MANKYYNRRASDGTMIKVLLPEVATDVYAEGIGGSVGLNADARQAKLSGGLWTLGSITTVESIAIPDTANGFRLRPSADVRFAVNEDPVVLAGESLVVGNTAYASETETRLLEVGTGRTLRLLGTAVNQTVGVGFF